MIAIGAANTWKSASTLDTMALTLAISPESGQMHSRPGPKLNQIGPDR